MKRTLIALTVATSVSFVGCTAQQAKQNTQSAWEKTTTFVKENATAVGAVTGAVLGYAVAGKSNRGLGILAGALAGGLIGNQLSKYLNEKERAELENHSLQQLNKTSSETTSTWASSETNASAEVKTSQSEMREKPVEIVKLKQVDVSPELELIGETYVTKTGMNVRYEPRIADNQAGSMKAGTEFTAIGKTTDDWVLAAQNGITFGYVKADPAYIGPAPVQVTAMRDEGIDLDAIDNDAVTAAIDLDGIDLDTVEIDKTTVTASTECRVVSYDITSNDGEKGATSFDACRGADGAWELS